MHIPKQLRKHSGKLVIGTLVLLACLWLVYTQRGNFDRESILALGEVLPTGWFVVAFLFLPLVGFPISILLVLAGIRFGLTGGMAIVAAGMIFHNYAAYYIAHGWFRDRVRRYLERSGYGIPPVKSKHRIWFTAVFAAIHGPPYVVKLYLLALTDIPRRIYVWVGAPVYIFFSLLPVVAGSTVTQFEAKWIYLLVTILIIFFLAGFWLKRRFGTEILLKSDN